MLRLCSETKDPQNNTTNTFIRTLRITKQKERNCGYFAEHKKGFRKPLPA